MFLGLILLALAVWCVARALRERRKKVRWRDARDRGQAGTDADRDRIRAEDSVFHLNW